MKSFLDFIQLSLFYIDPIARSSRRARAPTNKPGRKGPIKERDTWGPFPFPEDKTMILFLYTILTFINTSKEETSIWQKNCKSRPNKLNNIQTHLIKGFVIISFSGKPGSRYHYLKPHPVVSQALVAIVWFPSYDGRSGSRYRRLTPSHLVVRQALVTIIWYLLI